MKKIIIISVSIILVVIASILAYFSGKKNNLTIADIVRNSTDWHEG